MNEDAARHDEASPVDDDDLHILEGIRRGLEDVKAGRVMSREEFRRRVDADGD